MIEILPVDKDDPRAAVRTDRPLNLAQLAAEVGVPLCGGDRTVKEATAGTITGKALVDAIAAHVPTTAPPGMLSAEERLAILEQEVKGIKDRAAAEAAKVTPTAKGVASAIAKAT